MTSRGRAIAIVTTMSLVFVLGAAPVSKPASPASPASPVSPATSATTRGVGLRRGADAGNASVRAAVQTLTKEYEPVLRGGAGAAGTSVREESNYFVDKPDPTVTPDAIIAALQ